VNKNKGLPALSSQSLLLKTKENPSFFMGA